MFLFKMLKTLVNMITFFPPVASFQNRAAMLQSGRTKQVQRKVWRAYNGTAALLDVFERVFS